MNLLLIGDSHVAPIIIDFSGIYAHKENIAYHLEHDRVIHKHQIRDHMAAIFYTKNGNVSMLSTHGSGYSLDVSLIQDRYWFNSEDSITVAWLGYNDINDAKNHPNIENTVNKYLEKIIFRFGKSKIKLVYPIYNILIQNNEELKATYTEYCSILKEKAFELGLDEPMNVSNSRLDILSNIKNYERDGVHLKTYHYWDIWNDIRHQLGLEANRMND